MYLIILVSEYYLKINKIHEFITSMEEYMLTNILYAI